MQFRDNAASNRYELDTPEGTSFADYREHKGIRIVSHVETPAHARGAGYATELMAQIVVAARRDGMRIRPQCPFASAYFASHPDATDVLA